MQEGRTERDSDRRFGLFEAVGVEVEYMIVSARTLDVVPVADRLLEAVAGGLTDEWENGDVAWNNELALHVVELKCNGPRESLGGLAESFQRNVALANAELEAERLRLMPTAMHPWMDPQRVELWPHGSREIYEAFDRVFGCKGHGWANLQSAHINLPFDGDEEFGRLHAAIRLLLPILPGLAASSPALDGALTGVADNRLGVYRNNCARIPSITGAVIPEPIYSIGEYRERLLERLYADLAPLEPQGVLRNEWVNARGAIARFERMTVEIRVLDVQECPAMDVAFAAAIVESLKALCEERWQGLAAQRDWDTGELAQLLRAVERTAEKTEIGHAAYLRALGFPGSGATVAELWEHLFESAAEHGTLPEDVGRHLEHYLRHGSLSTRIVAALRSSSADRAGRPVPVGLAGAPDREDFERVYGALCDCLASGTPFVA